MSKGRIQHGIAAVEDNIYVVGGLDGDNQLCRVEVYNLIEKKWSFAPECQ